MTITDDGIGLYPFLSGLYCLGCVVLYLHRRPMSLHRLRLVDENERRRRCGETERRRGSMDRINQRHNLSNNEQNVLSCKNSALMLLPKCFTSRCVALDHVHEAVKCSSSAVYSDTNLRRPPPRLESIYHRHLAKLVPRC